VRLSSMFNLISKGTSDARSRAKCRWASAAKAAFYLAQVLLVLPADGRRTFFQQTVAFCAGGKRGRRRSHATWAKNPATPRRHHAMV
jgi:hypothetical protein